MYIQIENGLFVTNSVLLHGFTTIEQMSNAHREDGSSKDCDGYIVDSACDVQISVQCPKKD